MALVTYVSFFALLLQSFLLANSVPCPLEWESASSGSIPDQAVESGPGEYVARVFLDDWYAFKINPRLRKVSVVVDGKEATHENYEVLINPHSCVLKWVRASNKKETLPPEGVVPIAFARKDYVGRGKYDGYLISGMVSDKGLNITHQGKQIILPRYEILDSTYAKLYGSLTSIKFEDADEFYESAHQELIGSSLVEISLTGNHMDTERVSHEKVLQETFIFTEDDHDWKGISSMQVSFHLWFGTSDIKNLVQVNGKDYFEIERTRKLEFSKDILVGTNRNMQVCTFFLKPNPSKAVAFEAIAELTADGDDMTVDLIEEILEANLRGVLKKFPESKTVTTIIKGKMTGRFALDVGSKEFPMDRNNQAGKCAMLNDQPLSKSFI
ncbi:unnamed protein product [Allacma fusca]|uniref:Uncharacterized protein n=1 Tax=Allacma fusca TaxID=39272 RepID=A0A8J2NU07_9HEXA|nr:unnamed protein product [Allacma fusca]